MISEAEVFVLADRAAVQVYGQIREDQWETQLTPLFDMPGADQPIPLRQAINHVARHIGVDDGISEELAHGMWDGTEPSAAMWRSIGIFRTPVPVSDDASWRHRFLALTGREP